MKHYYAIIAFFLCLSIKGNAQIPLNPPSPYYLCDVNNDGVETFDLDTKKYEILGSLSPNEHTVTFHLTQADAANDVGAINPMYTNTAWNLTLFVRVEEIANPSNFGVTTLVLGLNQLPSAFTYTLAVCTNTSGTTSCVDLTSINNQVTGGNPILLVQYFPSLFDAEANTNQILNPSCYQSFAATPTLAPVYYSVTNIDTGCRSVGIIELVSVFCTTCTTPTASVLSTAQDSAQIVMMSTNPNEPLHGWEVVVQPAGGPPPSQGTLYLAPNSVINLTGLQCATAYEFYARTVCELNPYSGSDWSSVYSFTTTACGPQYGQPLSFQACVDGSNLACFDLTLNNAPIIGTHDPSQHTITYHASASEAEAGVNPIDTNHCVGVGSSSVYVRVLKNDGSYFTSVVFFFVQSYTYDTTPHVEYSECDVDNNGIVVFNLTNLASQISTSNTLEYYTSATNAELQQNPISTPSIYSANVQGTSLPIFVREVIPSACDKIHSFSIRTFGNCNPASTCQGANSLCGNLGIPFQNTVNVTSAGSAGCLGTTPNPTWFYMPISQSGVLNLRIEQNQNVNFAGMQLDVDYAIYGPFDDPITACALTTPGNIVNCSYSASPIEYPTFTAIGGKYYLVMVTNFSNQVGFIRISNMGSQAVIDCSGMQFQAFLDSNANGTMDVGESPFPLGEFSYERNNDGVVHHYSNPYGNLSLYDLNMANTYDVGFTIQSNYAAQYAVNPAMMSNLSITPGSGVQTYYFPVTVVQSYNDLAVSIVSLGSPRPGFMYTQRVIYSNLGNQTISSGSINYTKDALVTLINTPNGATPTANGFSYGFTNLAPFESRHFEVTAQVPAVPVVNADDVLVSSASILPVSGDVVPQNNDFTLNDLVINSYDPNDKMEAHGREIVQSQFTADDYLYYTIRFENTGTASAVNIRVEDILEAQLDETTVTMVASSHDYSLDRVGSTLTWRFPSINLPVSVANTTIGKGFVTFKVKPRAGYEVGDSISNTAYIYFDFNPAIITNTFVTLFVAPLATPENSLQNVVMYPNPTSGILTIDFGSTNLIGANVEVRSLLGAKVFEQKLTGGVQEQVDVSGLENGVYLVTIFTSQQEKIHYKLIKK